VAALRIDGSNEVEPGATVKVVLQANDPEDDGLHTRWTLMKEADSYITGGDYQKTPPSFPESIIHADLSGCQVQLPKSPGIYRLYVEIDDGNQAAATANVPIRVSDALFVTDPPVTLPYVIYRDADQPIEFFPSGWMGSHAMIKVSPDSADQPHSGATCLKCEFNSTSGWGGVAWQNPEGDWGEQPGGKNFTGATQLSFWARGKVGREKVKVGFGLLGREKAYFDTTKQELEIELTTAWQQFTLNLQGENLARIKTPFFWVYAAQGETATFYLDEIIVE
jgi:hypothetical protein